ncbi:MAG: beta-lactamase family protein [Mycobacterium sp.]|nr:beta-lactamase family protein [Mycobacterium sp.]
MTFWLPSVPRPPLGLPDPLRRIRLPKDLDEVIDVGGEDTPADGGVEPSAVQSVWKSVLDWYRSGVHPALQICVRRHGAVILNRSIGHARGNGPHDGPEVPRVPATVATPFCVYSTSKAITAFVVHKLAERGVIDLHDPVAEYIPGYERNRKHRITVGHVLAHRAAVPNLPRHALDLDNLGDRDFMTEVLSSASPFAKPGRYLAYHAVSGGFILGEVVHAATGKDIRAVLAEEFLDPLGFRWTNYGVAPADTGRVATNYVTGPPTAPPLSNLLSRALGVSLDSLVELTNDPRFLTGIVPAANTITTAWELSRFFEVMRCGGELDGVRVIETDTIRRALEERSHLEVDLSLGYPTRFSYGLMLGARVVSLYGLDTQHAFGHLGFTNMLAWADPERAISVAVLNSGKPIVYPEIYRFLGTMQNITSVMPKVSKSDRAL